MIHAPRKRYSPQPVYTCVSDSFFERRPVPHFKQIQTTLMYVHPISVLGYLKMIKLNKSSSEVIRYYRLGSYQRLSKPTVTVLNASRM